MQNKLCFITSNTDKKFKIKKLSSTKNKDFYNLGCKKFKNKFYTLFTEYLSSDFYTYKILVSDNGLDWSVQKELCNSGNPGYIDDIGCLKTINDKVLYAIIYGTLYYSLDGIEWKQYTLVNGCIVYNDEKIYININNFYKFSIVNYTENDGYFYCIFHGLTSDGSYFECVNAKTKDFITFELEIDYSELINNELIG